LQSRLVLEKSAITIAGQTAPADGITLKDYTFQIKNATNVIVRYLRCRLGDQNKAKGAKGGDDTLNTDDVDRLMVDHCSLSWAIDGIHDLRRGGNFTLQWCILSEALNESLHNKGQHAMCASYRDLSGNISLHHISLPPVVTGTRPSAAPRPRPATSSISATTSSTTGAPEAPPTSPTTSSTA
jgi:pectate lyase